MRTHTIDPPIIRVNSYFLSNAMDEQMRLLQAVKFMYSDGRLHLSAYWREKAGLQRNISYLDKLIDGLGSQSPANSNALASTALN